MQELSNKTAAAARDWSAVYIAIGTLPIWVIFAFFGHSDLGMNVWWLAMMFGLIVRLKPELRSFRWFWITLAVIACAHVPLVSKAPWNGKHWFGAMIKPFLFIDFALVYGIVYLCERIFTRRDKSEADQASQSRIPSLLD